MNKDGTFNPWRNTNWSPAGGGTYQDTLDMFLSEQEKKAQQERLRMAPIRQLDGSFVEFRGQLVGGPNGFTHGGRGFDGMGTGEMNMIGADGFSYEQRLANHRARMAGQRSPYTPAVGYSGMQQQRQADQTRRQSMARQNQTPVGGVKNPVFSGLGQPGNTFGNMKPRRAFR